MDGIVYITLEQALETHRKTIQYSGGGMTQSLDEGRLDSVLAIYRTIYIIQLL